MSEPSEDLIVTNIGRLVGSGAAPISDAAIVITGGRISFVGSQHELPRAVDAPELDAKGALVLPGFVDCHTHLIWAGSRRSEFEARLAGESYSGGGIRTTVAATRAASSDELIALAEQRALLALAAGTTTIEIKTGYGLSVDEELRLLEVIRQLGERLPIRIEPTLLAAHTIPEGRDRADYVADVIGMMPQAVAAGARWCDVFCDQGVFTVEETRAIFAAASAAGLGLRLHADQLARIGASNLAAECGCASADHLDTVDAAGAAALAAAGTVAVVLPTATLTMRTMDFGNARILREAGARIALATDANPGTSWCESMPYVIQLACLAMGMSVSQAIDAATAGGADALRRSDIGRLTVGACGDLVIAQAEHEADLVAHLGAPAVRATVVGGRIAAGS